MDSLILQAPVRTLDNRELLPAGTVLSSSVFDEIVSNHRALRRRGTLPSATYSLLEHGAIRNDIRNLLGKPPYDVIFFDGNDVEDLLRKIQSVRVIAPVLESLDYFKQHDVFTYRHILLVYALSTLLAADLLQDAEEWKSMINTGPTHDFGKVCTPLHLLRKTTPLTLAERRLLENHTLAGHVLLSFYHGETDNLSSVVARDHHERRNGSGYPACKAQRSLMVEIVAAADVYDALISPRPYRPVCFDNRTAIEEITAMAERGEIGWDVVKALVARNRGSRFHDGDWHIATEKRGNPPPGNVYGLTVDEEA